MLVGEIMVSFIVGVDSMENSDGELRSEHSIACVCAWPRCDFHIDAQP